MVKERASAFSNLDLDVSGFTPKATPDVGAPEPEKVRVVTEAADFRSRKSKPPRARPAKREPRRYRTGRNVQFNVKAAQSTIDAFYAISDQQGWVLGQTLEQALAALQRELASSKSIANRSSQGD